jgi:hypothetical protein
VGVPLSTPVLALKFAQVGAFRIEKVSAVPLDALVIG